MGRVEAVEFRGADDDYGGVVLIEHRTGQGTPFWLLVGHLDRRSVGRLRAGDAVRRGGPIGQVGPPEENGGWPPHIHVQLFTALLGRSTDLPGVVRRSEADVWESICPNPNLVLRAPVNPAVVAVRGTEEIAARRATHLSPTLSLSYDEPLHITAGEGAELIDAHGRRYLDLVNNVCHVGHAHPRVVAAIAEQAGRLNTNTRYLHANITEYARRLAATFPDPLNVVMLTNSGSEANDLALRMARTATGREHALVLDCGVPRQPQLADRDQPVQVQRPGRDRAAADRVRVCQMPDPYRGAFGAATAPALRRARRRRLRRAVARPAPRRPCSSTSASWRRPARSTSPTATCRRPTPRRARRRRSASPTRCRSGSAASASTCGPSSAGRRAGHRHAGQADRQRPSDRRGGDHPRDRARHSRPGWSTSTPSAATRCRARSGWRYST